MPGIVFVNVIQRILLFLAIYSLTIGSAEYIEDDISLSDNTILQFYIEYKGKYPVLSAPVITPKQEELILERDANFTLRCEAIEETLWVKWNLETKSWQVIYDNDTFPASEFIPDEDYLHLMNVDANDVTTFYCVYKKKFILMQPSKEEDIIKLVDNYTAVGIYIYVKETKQLIITDLIYYNALNDHWIIPCKPTEPSIEMLITQSLNNSSQTIIIANSTAILAGDGIIPTVGGQSIYKNITFHPRWGFTLQSRVQLSNIICTGIKYANTESKGMNTRTDGFSKMTIFSEKGHYAIVGESFNLSCEVYLASNSSVHLKWSHTNDDTVVQYNTSSQSTYVISDYIYVTTSMLTINTAQIAHSGIYKCVSSITNDSSSYETKNYNMTILYQSFLNVSVEGSNIIGGMANGTIRLAAHVDGCPQPTMDWYSEKWEKIEASGKFYFTEEGVTRILEIRHAQIMDSGIYTLKSSNKLETRNSSFDVRVFDVPKVEIDDTYARVNGEVLITCKVTSTTPSIVYLLFTKCFTKPHWPTCFYELSDNVYVNEPQSGNSKFESLHIYKYSPTGPEMVQCVAINFLTRYEEKITAYAYVFISDFEPNSNMTVFRTGGPRKLFRGDVIQIVCSAMVYHLAATEMQWYRNEELIKEGDGVDITTSSGKYTFNKTLTLKVSQVGMVTFECRAPYLDNPNLPKHTVRHTEFIHETAPPNFTYTNMNARTRKYEINGTMNLQCKGDGIPKPSVKWLKDGIELQPSDKILFDNNNSSLTIPFMRPQDEGTYMCNISNRLGYVEASTKVLITGMFYITAVWSVGIIGVCCGISLLVISLLCRICRDRAKIRKLKAAGLANFEKGAVDLINPDLPVGEQADLLPYDQRYEFPREKLHLGKQLGCGAFGVVFKASAQSIKEHEPTTVVAVKMVHQSADNEMMRALVSELKILVHLGRHLNVVNLLGAVTKNIEKRELMVIVEYCPLGCLKEYLVANREHFVNQISPETDEIDGSIEPQRNLSDRTYENVASSMRPSPTTCDLVCWALQVARGMNYLASKQVMHGDLALRNILLCESNIVKICDFGLARSLYKRSVYKKQGDAPLPIRWLALETFTDHIFNTYTDIWSFGIVLWELFSLGKVPYPEIGHENLFPMLRDGYRMGKPQFANGVIYEIMSECWSEEPTDRPLFFELERKLTGILRNAAAMRTYVECCQIDYLPSIASSCEASRPNPHYDKEPKLCEANSMSGDAAPITPCVPRNPRNNWKPEAASSEIIHHYENMPVNRSDLPTRCFENPTYEILEMK